MKKAINIILIFVIIFSLSFSINVFANKQLDSLDIQTSKDTIKSGENVTLTIEFGAELASYAFNIKYDHDLLQVDSVVGGTKNDDGEKLIVSYTDEGGGEKQTRSNMSVTFKAKEVEETNSATFTINSNGLSGKDPAQDTYDEIVEQTKNITINPDYKPYNIELDYTGDILMNVEKNMKLIVSSPMGNHYEHTRITAEITKPTGATATLMATDKETQEHDILTEGWKENEEGDSLGGKNAIKELSVRGLFSDAGKYSITFKVLDIDTDETVIVTKTIDLTVKDPNTIGKEEEEENNEEDEEQPNTMPSTGNTVYIYTIPMIFALSVAYIILKKKN